MWIGGYLGAVGRQHHLLRLGFGDGVGHVVADVIGGVLVASEEKEWKKRSEQRDFISRVFELGRGKNTHSSKTKRRRRRTGQTVKTNMFISHIIK